MNLSKIMGGRTYEPAPRLHDWYGHHGHRFPIKDGISRSDAWAKNMVLNMSARCPLLAALSKR